MNILCLLLLMTVAAISAVKSKQRVEEDECPIVMCHMNWSPVCARREGTDEEETFGNQCSLDRTNCFAKPKYVFVKQGEC